MPSPRTAPSPAFSPATFEFYEGLEADNSKAYWDDHKAIYLASVKGPMEALLNALEPEFGTWHMFRPNRDVRFSKDKSPYKEHAGGYAELEDGVGYYVQVSASGLMIGGGWWRSSPAQIARYREAVAGPDGSAFDKLVKALAKSAYTLDGDVLKTVPRGFDSDHPRADLLKHKTVTFITGFEPADWMETAELVKRVRTHWRKCQPTLEWLAQHVGPADDITR